MIPLVLIILACISYPCSSNDTARVAAPSGIFQGEILPDSGGIRLWKVIRYGNAERFKNPVPYTLDAPNIFESSSETPYICYQSHKACQDGFAGTGYCDNLNYAEDCLFLKITAPPKPPLRTFYPVMVYFHGSSFQYGNAYSYDGTSFASKGVIVVNVNYRLGLFGYLAGAKGSGLDGNYGFLDQRLALQWVQTNIRAFGGDPNKVTLTGQSAGAISVAAHLSSPGSNTLFRNVIMQSNPHYVILTDRTLAATQLIKVYNAVKGNCNSNDSIVICLKSLPPDDILKAVNVLLPSLLPVSPLVEIGGLIPDQPYAALSAGKYPSSVSILSGVDRDEGVFFIYPHTGPLLDIDSYHTYLVSVLGTAIQPLLPIVDIFYPFQSIPGFDGRTLVNQISTDVGWICPLLKMITEATPSHLFVSNYIYEVVHPYSQPAVFLGYSSDCTGYVCHGLELPLIHDNLHISSLTNDYTPTDAEVIYATNINNIWVNFVTSGNPNTGIPLKHMKIHAFNPLLPTINIVDIGTKSTNALYSRYDTCGFWNGLSPYPKSNQSPIPDPVSLLTIVFGAVPPSSTTPSSSILS